MSDRTQYLLELVKRNVKAYIANPKTKAVMVSGSVAEGLCDEYSDCDVMLYYDELPTEEELHLARQQNQGAELIEILGDRLFGAFGESFLINGVECQFAHATISQWEKEMSTVLEEFDVRSPIMKMLYGTLVGIPLYGEALIQQWKAKVANYPDRLSQTMVEKYLKFFPVWGMQEKLARRDTTLWHYQIMVEAVQNLLGVLSGLNRLYYSTFQFKRTSRFIEYIEIAPENLTDRLESLFHDEPQIAVYQLEELVRETVELVEIHMPQVDTSKAKRKLGWRQQPWKLGESDR
jgi:predicted nucleotidyltransferase